MERIAESELIINPDGSIFHLHLKPEQLANKVILVGDPGRVKMIASYFDEVECEVFNREFNTITGTFNGKRISVVSTGIGTDNIDIVVNELDAIVNIDFESRTVKQNKTTLELVRIGTTGGLQEEAKVDSFVMSTASIGFDGVLNYYARRDEVCDLEFEEAFTSHLSWNPQLASPYVIHAAEQLVTKFEGEEVLNGVTISAPGFYGPQGRVLRLPIADSEINDKITSFEFNGVKVTNYEMESSAIAGLGKLLGHKAVTLCAVIANRVSKTYSNDYKPVVKKLVEYVLDRI